MRVIAIIVTLLSACAEETVIATDAGPATAVDAQTSCQWKKCGPRPPRHVEGQDPYFWIHEAERWMECTDIHHGLEVCE